MGFRWVAGSTVVVLLGGLLQSAAVAQDKVAAKGEKYALLIGVRAYETPDLRPLKYTEDDVEELAKLLVKEGYPPANVRLMTQKEGATKPRMYPNAANIRSQLELFLQQMGEHDSVIVGLAGHGVQFADAEDSYFCPIDAKLNDRSTLVSLGQVHDSLKKCGAGFKLLLVDACRNNPLTDFGRDAGRPVVDLPSLSRPLKKRAPGGVAVLLSCSGGQRSFEHPDLKHGVFFNFVLRALEGEADFDSDGKVDLSELMGFTTKRVFRFVENELGVAQSPEFLGSTNSVDLVSLRKPSVPDIEKPKPEIKSETPSSKIELATRTPSSTMPSGEAPPAVKRETKSNSIGMKLVLIPSGEFEMGSADWDKLAHEDEQPLHHVRITQPFLLGAYEVTQAEYEQVVGNNPSAFAAQGKYGDEVEGLDTRLHPVENISWKEAINFCNAMSEKEKLKPYYQFSVGARSGGDGYRLPTEAEWEYACRAGSSDRRNKPIHADFAWWREDSGQRTHPVGEKRPNAFGLHDMLGNVEEYCWDWYVKDYYKQSPEVNPTGPLQGQQRIMRGGNFLFANPSHMTQTHRNYAFPDYKTGSCGFRVARNATGQ